MTNTNRVIRDDDTEADEFPNRQHSQPVRAPSPAVETQPMRRARARRSPGGNGAYPGQKQVTSYVERSLYLQLRAISAETDRSMIALMQDALTDYVQRYAAQRKFSAGR